MSDLQELAQTQPIARNRLTHALTKAVQNLLARQSAAGFWVGELEADASVTAGYIPLMYFLEGKVDPIKQARAVNYIRSKQNPDGSWSSYHAGPGDLNVTVQVYFALKLAGISADTPCMQEARRFILASGGLMKTNTITRIWLALFGQYEYRGTPSIPPEIALLPGWCNLSIYEMASWSRETIMALMLILAARPVCQVPESACISELYLEPEDSRRFSPAAPEDGAGTAVDLRWKRFFLALDAVFKAYDRLPFKPFRAFALRRIERWIVVHQEADGSWGGIMLPWAYSLIALKTRGYSPQHPVMKRGLAGLAGSSSPGSFLIEDNETLRLQPAVSPVWDTGWSVLALLAAGLKRDHPALAAARDWLLRKEIRTPGDWAVKTPDAAPGGWSFEFHNRFYPDMDDTAVVARALHEMTSRQGGKMNPAVERAACWIEHMQGRDGGWAAFDRDNNKQLLAHLPYGDFMSPLDPSCADVTAHVIELLAKLTGRSPRVLKAIEYLKQTQEPDGCWYGRWGVNYIYGTGLVLTSLKSAREDMSRHYVQKAASWLEEHQLPDGSWGETCETYRRPELRGRGPGTPSQTAWALMGLLAAGRGGTAVQRGAHYLMDTQNADGSWTEDDYTGTGFPRAFYLRYDLYRIYFPLLALALISHETRNDELRSFLIGGGKWTTE